MPNERSDAAIKFFKSKADWAAWLARHHRTSPGVWLRIAKKKVSSPSMTYKEALDVALCYGWIDGQKRLENEKAWLQKFAPRAPRSLWSKINRDRALALAASGEMQPAGLEAIENARESGRWDTAYDSPAQAAVPSDFQTALEVSPNAKSFFEDLDKANRYAILWRIQTVKKPETRARKIVQFVAMLERKEKIHH